MLNKFITVCTGLALVAISCRRHPVEVFSARAQIIDLDRTWPADPYMDSLMKPYSDSLAQSLLPLRIYNPEYMRSDNRTPALYNWFAGAMTEYVETVHGEKIDLAVFNAMSLRTGFPEGHPSEFLLNRLHPFGNRLIVLTLSGSELDGLFVTLAREAELGYCEAVYGLDFDVRDGKPEDPRIGEEPFDQKRQYRVLTTDYLKKKNNGMPFLSKAEREKPVGAGVIDALVWYARTHDTVRTTDKPYYKIVGSPVSRH